MQCRYISLGKTKHGKISMCAYCHDKIVLSYNNLSHTLVQEDFDKLNALISDLDPPSFFKKFPLEEKMNIRTKYKDLIFCFTAAEIFELKSLMAEASIKMKMLQYVQQFLN